MSLMFHRREYSLVYRYIYFVWVSDCLFVCLFVCNHKRKNVKTAEPIGHKFVRATPMDPGKVTDKKLAHK